MTDYDKQRDEQVEDLDVTGDEAADVKGGIISIRKAGEKPVEYLKLDGISGAALNWGA